MWILQKIGISSQKWRIIMRTEVIEHAVESQNFPLKAVKLKFFLQSLQIFENLIFTLSKQFYCFYFILTLKVAKAREILDWAILDWEILDWAMSRGEEVERYKKGTFK